MPSKWFSLPAPTPASAGCSPKRWLVKGTPFSRRCVILEGANAKNAAEIRTLAEKDSLPIHVPEMDVTDNASVERAVDAAIAKAGRLASDAQPFHNPGKGRVAKAVLISSIPPMLLKSDKNPDGLPMAVFDQLRDGTAYHRSQFYQDITVPFYGFNRPGTKISQGIRDNWWRQGMMGAAKAHYDCIKVLSESEFFEDLKMIEVPVLVMHGDDDQICPFESSGAKAVKLLKYGTLKLYPGFPHGMPTTHAEQINADLLTFFKTGVATAAA